MQRRTWTPRDPEPDDHPAVVDGHGDVWLWDSMDEWWSPTAPCLTGIPWDLIWDARDIDDPEANLKVSELISVEEIEELVESRGTHRFMGQFDA